MYRLKKENYNWTLLQEKLAFNHQQNLVELHGVTFLKHHGQILMDRTGAPP